MKIFLSIFLSFHFLSLTCAPLKVLHLTFHSGCAAEIEVISKELSLDLTTWYIPDLPTRFFDDLSQGSAIYNMGHDRAERIWNKHRDFFETFDVILTSDTAPLSRIFLQNQWTKPLIIWICNCFDYYDAASLDCNFPDPEYYDLFSRATTQKNVAIVGYTEFEHIYTQLKGIHSGNLTIKPSGACTRKSTRSSIPQSIVKEETFFLPPYHNETIFMDLSQHCRSLGIQAYCGRYQGPDDLRDFKGVIHIPYAWSNLALFENLNLGIPYFIPSPAFMLSLISKGAFFRDGNHTQKFLNAAEWFSDQYSPCIVYFDSWEDLVIKVQTYDYQGNRQKILDLAKKHQEKTFSSWKTVFNQFGEPREN